MISLLTVLINNGKAREGALNRCFVTISLELAEIETDIAPATAEVERVQDKLRRLETARAQKKYECRYLPTKIKLIKTLPKTPPASQSTMIQPIMMKTPLTGQ